MPKSNKLSCSYATQNKIAQSLKEIMTKKPFEKISVSDITQHCNIHRQTFYYHFVDKYDLLDWIIRNELVEPFIDGIDFKNMYVHFEKMFEAMKSQEAFFKNAFRIDYDTFASFISKFTTKEFISLVDSIEENAGIKLKDDEDKLVFAEFLGFGITGIVFTWSQRGMKESPQVMTGRIKNIVNGVKQIMKEQ